MEPAMTFVPVRSAHTLQIARARLVCLLIVSLCFPYAPLVMGDSNTPAESIRPASLTLHTSPAPSIASPNMPLPSQSFDGLYGGGDPPNPSGDVGPHHYIQAINSTYAIYDKSGTRLAGPALLNALFAAAASTGTPCDDGRTSDPNVLYDPLDDRWVLAFQAAYYNGVSYSPPFYECIAVSRTPDPIAGGWHLYALATGAGLSTDLLNTGTRLAVWPDAYYMSTNLFNVGLSGQFDHVRVWAIDRVALLTGRPLREVHFDLADARYRDLLPANMRGHRPPAGSPGLFMAIDRFPSNVLHLWRFNANFDIPSGSWFGASASNAAPDSILVSEYTQPDFPATQPGLLDRIGSPATLDAQARHLMAALQYRNMDGVESLWVNHTVAYNTAAYGNQLAIRWYEIRNLTNAPFAYQEHTFTNGGDGVHRWVGALATDRFGNMALGYSASRSNPAGVYPSLRYSGRLWSDPANVLPQNEVTLTTGTTPHGYCDGYPCTTYPWGQYSAMSVDPSDDCTYWYTGEYGAGGDPLGYRTRIGAFRHAACAQTSLIVDRSDDEDVRSCTSAPDDCTLRGAINFLNDSSFTGARITFSPTIQVITLSAPLPVIASSHNGIQGVNGLPRIDGQLMADSSAAFIISATEFSLSGLSIVNLSAAGSSAVRIVGGTRNQIHDNYLGTLPSGLAVTGCTLGSSAPGGAVTRNAQYGILVEANVTHGSFMEQASVYIYRNTFGCHDSAIYLHGADGVAVGLDMIGQSAGNLIGLNDRGTALPNGVGVLLSPFGAADGAGANTIAHNTIAHSIGSGISLVGTDGAGGELLNTISGNSIYGNGVDGVSLSDSAAANVIGGSSVAERNLIYGNGGSGVSMLNSAGNGVLGNLIGSVAGAGCAANGGSGVLIEGGHSNWVGGVLTSTGRLVGRNVIGGNGGDGVRISNGSYENTVSGNYLGTNADATAPAGNGRSGVAIASGAHDNMVGGLDAASANIIGGNTQDGVVIAGSATSSNTLALNEIGLNDQAGMVYLPNSGNGLALIDGTFGNVITGTNRIAYNQLSGAVLSGGAHDNVFDAGNELFGNSQYGILLDGASKNVIRSTSVHGNGLDGIGERGGAHSNRWSMLSTYRNGGMGIDRDATFDNGNLLTPPLPASAPVMQAGSVVTVSGTGQPSLPTLAGNTVEVYAVSVNAQGFGEGLTYLGSTGIDASGSWSLRLVQPPSVCFVAFETVSDATSGERYSTEFGTNTCRKIMPLVRRES